MKGFRGGNKMDTSLDLKFAEKSEAIVTQLGFKDLKSFVKNQALLMLIARIEKYEAENKHFEAKYHMPFKAFQEKVEGTQNEEMFTEDDDYLDWRFAKEAIDRLNKQKRELEYALLDLIVRFKHVIKSFHISMYEQEGEILRFKAQLTFINDSKLFIKEYLFENKERKYAYHWTDTSGNLICRWDNTNHWPGISTFPHHKHTGNEVFESTETSVGDVL